MILDQISWADIFVFLIFLIPQILYHVDLVDTLLCGLKALPFLLILMPYQLVRERYFTPKSKQSPFVQQATLFQDIVVRCVRYAFASIPASIGRIFFSKWVALPFMRFRMLRNGIFRKPVYWREVKDEKRSGIFMVHDATTRPDIIVYYIHGGGFCMGSSYFYLEFLLAWMSMLKEAGYQNPAVFALEYTLVPEATYPTQVQEAMAGYKYVLSIVDDPSRIVVSGDSAGGTLVLSLLLCLSDYSSLKNKMPGFGVILSPWTSILSPKNANTASDYLDAESLSAYGKQYLGTHASSEDPLVSPGSCKSVAWWKRASPTQGWFFIYGAEEVFAPEIRDMIALLDKTGVTIDKHEEKNWVHAWPVVKLFLCNKQEERQSGLRKIVRKTTERIPRVKAV